MMAKAEELRNLGIVEEADLEEVDEDFLRDPECTINLVTKRRLRKMKAAWDARKIERLSAVAALGFAPAAPGFSADGAAGGKRAKETEPEAAGEATKQPCVSAPGADGEPAFGGASAVVAAAAPPGADEVKTKHVKVTFTYSVIPPGRGSTPEPEKGWGRKYRRAPLPTPPRVEQPGREEEQMQSQDWRGQEAADNASHALLQGKASPAPRSPSTPKSSLPTPTWGESAPQSCPSLTVGSAQLGGRQDEAAGSGFGGFGDPPAGGGFGLVAGGGFVAPADGFGAEGVFGLVNGSVKKLLLRDLALHLGPLFVEHIGPWLDTVNIARLAITCKWNCDRIKISALSAWAPASQPDQDNLTERLYKQVCDRLEFKQTGSRFRPVPWVQIFAQHLCVECWKPAVSTGSVHVDLNGGRSSTSHFTARDAVKWVCGDCRKTVAGLKPSELKSKGLPQTAVRFDDAIRRKILHSITAF